MKFKNTLKKLALSATLILSTSFANAGFVNTDWKVDGDAEATLHQESGIEWLKLNHTAGMSIDNVVSQLDTTYEGWRLPTKMEVTELISDLLSPHTFNDAARTYDSTDYLGYPGWWISKMGLTRRTPGSFSSSFGMHMDGDGGVVITGAQKSETNSYARIYHNQNFGISGTTYRTVAYSVFLVSDGGTTLSSQSDPAINANNASAPINDVPVALAGLLSFIGLFAARRRKV
jgi:hypothetical protein